MALLNRSHYAPGSLDYTSFPVASPQQIAEVGRPGQGLCC